MKFRNKLISAVISAAMTVSLFAGISAGGNGETIGAKVLEGSTVTITADCSNVTRKVEPGTFGYILTPNYDVPDSRMTLLGKVLNRESLPVQNFQACGDMDGGSFKYERDVKERHLEAYRRAKANNADWYMLMGMNPSWATASGNPTDTSENKPLKTPEQLANFKQYLKDFFQYLKDNGAKPDYADLTNEYWTGTEETFKAVWEALREVYPDYIPVVGPGGVGYDGIPDYYIPYSSQNQITVEGPSWHAYWIGDTFASFSQLTKWYEGIKKYQDDYPEANGKYIIWEENNAGSTEPTDWTRSMSNVIRTGVDRNIKGCLESQNWNGMSDLMSTVKGKSHNPAVRRGIWWVYYMFGQMTGNYVSVDTTAPDSKADDEFTGAVAVDAGNKCIKAVIAKDSREGNVKVELNNIPFEINGAKINLYRITESEDNGLTFEQTITPDTYSLNNMTFTISSEADDTWYAVVEPDNAAPGFFAQTSPDDGEVAEDKPEFKWSESVNADSYTLIVSKNKDLSDPVINKSGITSTSYTSDVRLEVGSTYYWGVTAVNSYGQTANSHDVRYKVLIGDNADVPGQFGPYMPSVGAKNEPVTPELTWSTAYGANSYHVVISENEDMSNPVVDVSDIRTVRGTGQFGSNSQGYYKVSSRLEYKKKYYWMIYASNSNGERPMNGVPHYFTTCAAGDAPEEFSLISPSDGAVNVPARTELVWEDAANAFFYQLIVSENPDLSNPVIQRDYMIYNKYTVEQNALEPGRKYYWSVRAFTKNRTEVTDMRNGVWEFSVEKVPAAPLLYAEQPVYDEGEVTVWYHASNSADSYNIYYGKEPGVYTRKIQGITSNNYTISGLKGGQQYYFAVTAVNDAGESSIWNERSVTPYGLTDGWSEAMEEGINIAPVISPAPQQTQQPQDKPSMTVVTNPVTTGGTNTPDNKKPVSKIVKPGKTVLKKAVSGSKGTINVSWKKAGNASGYQIVLAYNKKMTKGKKTIDVKGAKTVSKTIKKLSPKSTYYVKVRAYSLKGKLKTFGKWSSVKKVKVHA